MLARSQLERRTPLRRSWIRRRKPKRIAKRAALRPYLALVAKMPCAGELGVYIEGRGWREHFCQGPVQVMHLGRKPGVGLKCPDDEVGPGCLGLHTALDQHRGEFKGLNRDERRVWCDWVISECRKAAIPTDETMAIDLENLGLGKRVAGEGGRWTWESIVRVDGAVP